MSGGAIRSGIQEALEKQVVLERIDVGDAQAVGHQAADHGAAPRPDRDVVVARILDQIPDDQEIAGEFHLLDHLDLEGEPLLRSRVEGILETAFATPRLSRCAPPLGKSFAHDLFKIGVGGVSWRHFKGRQGVATVSISRLQRSAIAQACCAAPPGCGPRAAPSPPET